MHFALPAFVSLALASTSYAAVWNKALEVTGAGYYDNFVFETIVDPTHGRVEYVDQCTAISNNLTFSSDDTFILRADYQNVVASNEAGRKSFRLRSTQTFEHHLAIFNVKHMPQGCGTWPSIWETGKNWPYGGEVDIIEGANGVGTNTMALHTSPGCTMPANRNQTGKTLSTDCSAFVNGNTGCGVADPNADSFGPTFNQNGGGVFAMERTMESINIWFWPSDKAPPSGIRNADAQIDTSGWGEPAASFVNSQCDIEGKFSANNIIIYLNFCGDWAGNTFNANGCSGNCNDYVNNNPAAFADAYFELGTMLVYQ